MVKRDGSKSIAARRLYQTPIDYSSRWIYVASDTFALISLCGISGGQAFWESELEWHRNAFFRLISW